MNARELYADDDYAGRTPGGYWFPPSSYQPLLDSIGNVTIQVDSDGYQGDSWVLYRNGDRFGFLTFGWGSCSGCDWLQGCTSWEDVEELRQHLEGSVVWGSATEVRNHLTSQVREGDWYYHRQEWERFRDSALERLEDDR